MTNVVRLHTPKPRTYTSAETMLEAVRIQIQRDGRTQQQIAEKTGVVKSTIYNIASGNTKWPRATTLFPLMHALGMHLTITYGRKK